MAKLSARGRVELVRFSKEVVTVGDPLVARRKTELALVSDGRVLRREVVWFREDTAAGQYGNPRHDYGWKLWKRFKNRENPEHMKNVLTEGALKVGYEKVK